LVGTGFFINPKGLKSAEQALLRRYAKAHKLPLITVAAFINDIFYALAYELRANIVCFNLPFDISRLAVRYNSARGKTMKGGFTFQLSEDQWKPRVQIRHLSARAALKQFTKPRRQFNSRGMRKRGLATKARRGSFIDLKTTAAALTSRSFTLATLADFLNTPHRKQKIDEHGGALTETYIDYAVNDIQVTWECYVVLCKKFEKHGLRKTLLSQLLSEASLGKAYLREMEIRSWRESQTDFPDSLTGIIMSTYYGGRSEVRIRRLPVQVQYCDFLSMYPTVCALMGLWRFVTAKGITWRESASKVSALLDSVTPEDLQRAETWSGLTTIVQVISDDDCLPLRTKYDGEPQARIGLNYLKSKTALWFTLADCIASKLLTGKCPKVVRAISFAPGELQDGLKPIAILGDPNYMIDPGADDFYRRLIDLRIEIKRLLKTAKGPRAVELEAAQQFLKILANATSYGIFVELIVAELDEAERRLCFGRSGEPFAISTTKIEEPGRYFHPLLATLITGAARLMLAMTQTLANRAGLDWAFCDTDSMALAKPESMTENAFYNAAQSVRDWFTPLNPYKHQEPLLKLEDANCGVSGSKKGRLVPLFCLAISDKRYVLFNIGPDGKPTIRKASGHGLGYLRSPYSENDAPATIPEPAVELERVALDRWQYDLWYQIILATLEGHPDIVDLDYHPALTSPAASRYGATTPALLRWFKKYNEGKAQEQQVWPFNFMLAYQVSPHRSATASGLPLDITDPCKQPKWTLSVPKPVAPYDTNINRAAQKCFDRQTGKAVSAKLLMTYREALAQYHLHPESKFLNGEPYDRGRTLPRHVEAIAIHHIGKEANRWEEQYYLGLNIDAQVDYGMVPEWDELQTAVKNISTTLSRRELADKAGISRTRLSKLWNGQPVRNAGVVIERVLNAVREVDREKREANRLSTMRPKDQWLHRIGGFRAGESPTQLRNRIAEIERLEKLLVSGGVTFEGLEQIQRRLCTLKGIYFDDYDPSDD
jgi:transcriptional regulator with XRE-family HTH domain